jgi:predicted metal-dependent peptidase
VFTADNLDDIMDWEVGGGGGTMFMCNWQYMRDNETVPKKFVMFTDGYYGDSWGDPDYCDTIFIIHSNANRSLEGPFGITAHYEEANA